MEIPIDYAKLGWRWQRQRQRFARRVEADGLTCQDCGGAGGEREPILDDGSGPWEECGWCQGTGLVTPWLRGQWLKYKRMEKRTVV